MQGASKSSSKVIKASALREAQSFSDYIPSPHRTSQNPHPFEGTLPRCAIVPEQASIDRQRAMRRSTCRQRRSSGDRRTRKTCRDRHRAWCGPGRHGRVGREVLACREQIQNFWRESSRIMGECLGDGRVGDQGEFGCRACSWYSHVATGN